MGTGESRETGIASVSTVRWGTHFGQLHNGEAQAWETFIPFLESGLRANENCLWLASADLPAEQVAAELVRRLPATSAALASGQLLIVDATEGQEVGEATTLPASWIERAAQASLLGYAGLRVLNHSPQPPDEPALTAALEGHRIIALYAYRAASVQALDVIHAHHFVLAKQREWRVITSRAQVAEATESVRELEVALENKDAQLRDVYHRIKNNLQLLISVVGIARRRVGSEDTKRTLDQVMRKLHAVSAVQTVLYRTANSPTVSARDLVVTLCDSLRHAFDVGFELHLDVQLVEIPNDTALPLALIVSELVSNAVVHGLRDRTEGIVWIGLNLCGEGYELTVEDDGPGFELLERNDPSSGLGLVNGFARRLGGRFAIHREQQRMRCSLRFPASAYRAA
jgi:two-component sensor histidine kinase